MRKYYLTKSLNLEELKMEDKTLVCKDCGKRIYIHSWRTRILQRKRI